MNDTEQPLTPQPIFQALTGFWVSATLSAAIRLGVFGAIAKGASTAAEIAEAIGAPERSTRMLCDALCGIQFLSGTPDGGYALPPVSAMFLDPAKPSYFGTMDNILTSPLLWNGHGALADAVRNGGSTLEKSAAEPDHEFWSVFVRSSLPLAGQQGEILAAELESRGIKRGARVLDIACGSGAYGFSIARRDPAAHITSLDAAHVLPETRKIAAQFGVSDRVSYIEGDMFSAGLGKDYDVVLLTNIYHHFDRDDCVRLTRRVREAIAPGGIVAVAEFVPDDERKTATLPLLFGMTMLALTPGGNVYTLADYRAMFEECGFDRVESLPTGPQTFIFARAK